MKPMSITGLIVLLSAGPLAFGQVAADRRFPGKGVVTGDNVNVRSGPGTNWYRVQMLARGTVVTLAGEKHGWYKIVPPARSFSWVARDDVAPGRSEGFVQTRSDNVPVRAGSRFTDERHVIQKLLSKGTQLKVTGEKGEWYKVEPPEGSYVWISAKWTARSAKITKPAAVTTRAVTTQPAQDKKRPKGPLGAFGEQLTSLDDELRAEWKKPALEQRLERLRTAYQVIADQQENPIASKYAQRRSQQIDRRMTLQAGYQRLEDLGRRLSKVHASTKQQIGKIQAEKLQEEPILWQAEGVLSRSKALSSSISLPGGKLLASRLMLREPAKKGSIRRTIAYIELARGSKLPIDRYLGKYVAVSGQVRYDAKLQIKIITVATIRERQPKTAPRVVKKVKALKKAKK